MKFFHLFSRSTWQITLFRFNQRKLRRLRPAARVYSALLPKLSIMVFLLGCLTAFLRKTPLSGKSPTLPFLLGLALVPYRLLIFLERICSDKVHYTWGDHRHF